ncbi:hypothetical protein RDWZM_007374 [Blomia tropicalis]|uniref:Uncharacterized protein n=1 Tax=Blomia tropicalis TaxID=40697 RepID=A0A9Q0LZS1_BLOTA|nr:hypothetical protein RDWZM_007374 [Blomia tropicalis]
MEEEESNSNHENTLNRIHNLNSTTKLNKKIMNSKYCYYCRDGGDLLCCDRCPAVFHPLCHEPPLDKVPDGDWFCYKCVSRNNMTKSDLTEYNLIISKYQSIETPYCDFMKNGETTLNPDVIRNCFNFLDKYCKLRNPKPFELPENFSSGKICKLKKVLIVDEKCNLKELRQTQYKCISASTIINFFKGVNSNISNRLSKKNSNSESIFGANMDSIICRVCMNGCQGEPLLKCDICPFSFHIDCLELPLTKLPNENQPWTCPINHLKISDNATNDQDMETSMKMQPSQISVPMSIKEKYERRQPTLSRNGSEFLTNRNLRKSLMQTIVDSQAKSNSGDNGTNYWQELPVRAIISPIEFNSMESSKSMVNRIFTIGTRPKNDLNLSDYCHCNYFSSKHAVIYYDEYQQSFELINYSQHGTCVDNVFYSLDFSDKFAYKAEANTVNENTKDETNNESSQSQVDPENKSQPIKEEHFDDLWTIEKLLTEPNRISTNLKNLSNSINKDRQSTYKNPMITIHKRPKQKMCNCDELLPRYIDGYENGWEGSAILQDGSHIVIGCLELVFTIFNNDLSEEFNESIDESIPSTVDGTSAEDVELINNESEIIELWSSLRDKVCSQHEESISDQPNDV